MVKAMRSSLAIPCLLLLVLPARSAAKPGVFASLGLGHSRSAKAARPAAKAAVAVTQSPDRALPAPPVDQARSLLLELDRAQLSTAMRWAGVEPSELLGGRETTNLGLDRRVDRWRLPSAEAALVDPLWLPDRVGDLGQALSADLSPEGSSSIPSWTSLRTLAAQEFGHSQMVGCLSPPSRGLYREAVEGPGLRRRQAAYLREQLSIRLDAPVGDLLSQASLARCRLDLALSRLSAEDRAAVRAALASGLLDQVDSEDDARASRALALSTAWEKVDRSLLVAAGVAWSQAVRSTAEKLRALPLDAWPDGPLQVQTALGTVWIGSPENDIMEGDPMLILDPGGDDDWTVARDRDVGDTAWVPPVRGVIDLGGNDRYGGGAASVGGALLGLSAGVDLGGDDSWRTGALSQGAAWFGVSTWVDLGGDDTFVGPVAVQGFAAYGLAVLRTAGQGDDTLRAGAWAQGCAWSGGVGLLHDGGGDDRYVLGGTIEDSPNRLPGYHDGYGQGFSVGQRPWLGGGIGWLQDDGGHDRYSGGLWVQGSSYWHSLGVLLDRSGNDVYTSDQYSQGSGIHLSAAGLFDLDGDDRYLTRNLGQGSGHDLAVSWLLDGGGTTSTPARTRSRARPSTTRCPSSWTAAGMISTWRPPRSGRATRAWRAGTARSRPSSTARDATATCRGWLRVPTRAQPRTPPSEGTGLRWTWFGTTRWRRTSRCLRRTWDRFQPTLRPLSACSWTTSAGPRRLPRPGSRRTCWFRSGRRSWRGSCPSPAVSCTCEATRSAP
jgi:hypothetical protein